MKLTQSSEALDFIDSIESTWKGHEQFALWLVKKIKPKVVVDLGVDRGLSTLAFAYKNKGHVFGVDWFFEEGTYADKSFALDCAFQNISDAIHLNYVKNIHLIIGPYREVLKNWNLKIDVLHIDWVQSYRSIKFQYDSWSRHLKKDAVVLIHDVVSLPDEVGKFYRELPLPKFLFTHCSGLGVICSNVALIEEIRAEWG